MRDVATLRDDFTETFTEATFNGLPAVMLTVNQTGKQAPEVVARAVEAFTEKKLAEHHPR